MHVEQRIHFFCQSITNLSFTTILKPALSHWVDSFACSAVTTPQQKSNTKCKTCFFEIIVVKNGSLKNANKYLHNLFQFLPVENRISSCFWESLQNSDESSCLQTTKYSENFRNSVMYPYIMFQTPTQSSYLATTQKS